VAATASPSYVIADPAAGLLFAVNETPQGAVSSFAIEPSGALRQLSTSATGGNHPCHLVLHSGHVLAANYTSGSVSVHPVGPSGVLGPRTDLVHHMPRCWSTKSSTVSYQVWALPGDRIQ
jgi:6-phosphogluconolactonase